MKICYFAIHSWLSKMSGDYRFVSRSNLMLILVILLGLTSTVMAKDLPPSSDELANEEAVTQAPVEAEAIIKETDEEGEPEDEVQANPNGIPSSTENPSATPVQEGGEVPPTQNQTEPKKSAAEIESPKVKKKGKAKNKRQVNSPKRLRRFPTNRPDRALNDPPALGKIPFPLGETLTYKVNMLNAHSGTVTLKVGRRGKVKDQTVLELSGFVQSSPVLENFYPIRDSLRVLVDERTFLPVKSEFFLNEKGRKIDYVSDFDQSTGRLDWTKEREVKGKKRKTTLSYMAPHPMHQTLSSLYALRRLNLEVGMSFEQYIWDGQRERLILVKVTGEERVLTGIGWVEAYKLEITGAVTGGIISKRTLKRPPVKGSAWIAKDAYRTPIKAITPTKLGQAEAVLSARAVQNNE